MNNRITVKGLEIQVGNTVIKLDEFQTELEMQEGTASEYMTVLKQFLQIIQGEIEQNRSAELDEILAVAN
jgi:hypothetical protein